MELFSDELAVNRRDFGHLRIAAVRVGSATEHCQVEGGCTKSDDKAKTQTYCQIAELSEQIDQEKDRNKAEALSQKINGLEKQLGPEYLAFVESTQDLDPNSKDGRDVVSMFDELDASCR